MTLTLAGSETDHAHLAVVATEPMGGAEPGGAEAMDIDAAVLRTLEEAPGHALARAALRATLRLRNQRLGAALSRLSAAGAIVRRGEAWAPAPAPIPGR